MLLLQLFKSPARRLELIPPLVFGETSVVVASVVLEPVRVDVKTIVQGVEEEIETM